MALLIGGTIQTEIGLEITSAYSRLTPILNDNGLSISIHIDNYVSKNAYLQQQKPLQYTNLPYFLQKEYDRLVDGVDILDISHDYVIEKLVELGFTATKDLD